MPKHVGRTLKDPRMRHELKTYANLTPVFVMVEDRLRLRLKEAAATLKTG
jgi:hypothetical protein